MSIGSWLFVYAVSAVVAMSTDYFIDSHLNCSNNIYNNLNNPYNVKYLGTFSNVDDCINECIYFTKNNNDTGNICNSYTYFKNDSKLNGNNSGQCWSMINNKI